MNGLLNVSRVSALFGLAALAAAVGGCGAPSKMTMDQAALSRVRTVAILPFKGGDGVAGCRPGDAVAAGLAEALRNDVPRWDQAERTRLKDLVSEKRGAAVSAEGAKETDIGKFLQVDAIVTGTIQEYSRNSGTRDSGYGGGHTVGAAVKIIDVRTGLVIYSHSGFAAGRDSFTDAVVETCRLLTMPLKTMAAR